MSKEIKLLNRAGRQVGAALVDDEDFDRLNQHRWHMKVKAAGRCYARRAWREEESLQAEMMHVAVLGKAPSGMVTDHINRNSLDNRRCNLRFVTRSGSMQNRGVVAYSTSGIRNVTHDKKRGYWFVTIKRDGERIFRKACKSLEEAIPLANAKRAELLPYATD